MRRVFSVIILCHVFMLQPCHTTTCNSVTCIQPMNGGAFSTFNDSLAFFMKEECNIQNNVYPTSQANDEDTFDYIIVGAGTAGCIVARRLVDQNFKVLLLEAGPEAPIEAVIPNLYNALYKTKYDWQYYTVNNNKTSQALTNGKVYWPRGKVLGGTHQLNLMFYYKGSKFDYKSWTDLGNTGWSQDIIDKYFKKAESFQNLNLLKNEEIRNNYGLDGPLVINTMNYTYRPIINKVLQSFQEMGIKNKKDLSTANLLGSGIGTVTATSGIRTSTYAAYIDSINTKTNLIVMNNAYVTEILIDDNLKANGVKVDVGKEKRKFNAKFEIILSAGSVNTPHLLMLSGVGNKKHLESKKIKCKVNLPAVGENLQDHAAITIPIMADALVKDSDTKKQLDAIKYLYDRTGYLAQLGTTDISTFYSRNKSLEYPEFQNLLSISDNPTDVENFYNFLGFNNNIVQSLKKLAQNQSFFIFETILLNPLSRGAIKLNSSDPYDHPIIDPNYFGDKRDLEIVTEGVKIFSKIINTKYFKSMNAQFPRYDWPACNNFVVQSKDYWRCIAKNTVSTLFHPVGTSSMGPDPLNFVVDDRLRVHKIKNLRVVDASIMPNITRCNTNGPTVMIAERGSALIIEDHNKLS